MSFEPNKITREHVLRAIGKIEQKNLKLIPSTKFDVIINGKTYPPKDVMRFAHQEMNGEFIWIPGGGPPTNKFLEKLGFEIKTKFDKMEIIDYLQSLRNFLDAKPANSALNSFIYESIDTETRMGSIGGGWKDVPGYRIRIPKLDDTFILRLTDKYVVFESIRRRSQLANYQLIENQNFISDSDTVTIKESYRLTLRNPILTQKVKDALINAGFNKEGIISTFNSDDLNPQEELIKWIEWAVFREKAKEILRSQSIEVLEDDATETNYKSNWPLNNILYGPPGTGKTYHTIPIAISIIERRSITEVEKFDRETLKYKFRQYQSEGKIEFTTFHQSMSYEDFIEGIKPLTQDGEVIYEIQEGIFKRLCRRSTQKSITKNNFQEAYKSLLDEIKQNGGTLILETTVHSREFTIRENSRGNLTFHANTDKAYEGTLKKEILEHFLKTGEALDWPSYTKAIAKHLEIKHKYSQNEVLEQSNYVLIIDEINRGNISQIFGELISLIEDDKRQGNDEALEVILPYSKEKFSVPSNLYLIGTMNTADRSVEALDTALRRRFTFVEMPPQPEELLVKDISGVDLQQMLKVINQRIEKLIDKDHRIGHAYFMGLENSGDPLAQLKIIFQNKILPLLQEYFYGNYGKMQLVLGKDFVHKDTNTSTADFNFAENEYQDHNDTLEREVYHIVNWLQTEKNKFDNNFITAIKNIYTSRKNG